MSNGQSLTATDLLAHVTHILVSRGYSQVPSQLSTNWPVSTARVFEDSYGIVGIAIYETWADLLSTWTTSQGAFVDLISRYVRTSDAKAWDGYLVLMTPSVGPNSQAEAKQIRYDTSHVRKLVATGDELRGLEDVERVILPLLPLADVGASPSESALTSLPELLAAKAIPKGAVSAIVDAFLEQAPLIEKLHNFRTTL